MDGLDVMVASSIHRERTAALEHEHRARRSVSDRGTVVAPERPAVAAAGFGAWVRRHAHLPHRPHRSRLA